MSANIVDDGYFPTFPPERNFYEGLWKVANPNEEGSLSGGAAVAFFQKSEVNPGILKQIWSLSTSTASMNKQSFFTALRYIVMVQNGDMPLSKEKLVSSAGAQFPPPKFIDIQLPQASPRQLPPAEAYAMSPEEVDKLENLFKNYDTDHDGFLLAKEAHPVFVKSGLNPQILQAIWMLADHDRDNKLNVKEFTVAFHLIVCVSKKRLPIPPPGSLPPPLLSHLTSSGGPSQQQQQQHQQQQQQQPVPQQQPISQEPIKALSVSDAFGDVSVDDPPPPPLGSDMPSTTTAAPPVSQPIPTMSTPTQQPPQQSQQPSHQSPPPARQPQQHAVANDRERGELEQGVMAVTGGAKRMKGVNDGAMETMDKTHSGLKYLIQKLNAEKISLTAAVSNAEGDCTAMNGRIEASFGEVAALRAEMDGLRERLLAAYAHKASMQDKETDTSLEKQKLQLAIEEGRRELSKLLGDKVDQSRLLGELGEQVSVAQAEYNRISQNITESTSQSSAMQAELQLLMSVKSDLQKQQTAAAMEVTRISNELSTAKSALSTHQKENSLRAAELSRISNENIELRAQIDNALKEIEALKSAPPPHVPMSMPSNMPPPVQTSTPAITTKPETKISDDSGFNTGFGTTTETSGNDDGGFGSGFGTTTETSGNDDGGFGSGFGTTTEASGNDDGGFGSGFGTTTETSGNDDGGFGSGFGSPTDNKTSDDDGFGSGFGSATTNEDGGFGSGFGTTTEASGNDNSGFGSGFGATTTDGDGFGSGFGTTTDNKTSDEGGFGSGFGTSTSDDSGFGASFGTTTDTNGGGDDGFGSAGFGSTDNAFGNTSTTNGDDGFSAFGSDGFGSTTLSTSNDDGFGF